MKKPGAGHLLRMVIIQACLCLSLVSPCLAVEKGLPPVLPAVAVKNITYVVYDLKNGGIAKTFRGFLEAASELNWRVSVQNGNGDPAKVAAILAQTASQHVDGIVIGGFDASQYQPQLKALRSKGVILLGWHAADRPGPTGLLFNNITTDPETVARMALDVALNSSHAGIGMVIFTDQHFSIARRKTEAVLKLVKNCSRCEILSVQNIDISKAAAIVPQRARELLQRFGNRWNYSLAVNDVYFDNINHAIENTTIQNISAGDGSYTAISRIRSGRSRQIATIAEPTGQQAWQMADEFRRAFSLRQPSGQVCLPILITQASLTRYGSIENMENIRHYKENYRSNWAREDGHP